MGKNNDSKKGNDLLETVKCDDEQDPPPAATEVSQTNEGSTTEPTKKEENPFSFKHFLKRDQNSSTTSVTLPVDSSHNETTTQPLQSGGGTGSAANTSSSSTSSTGARPKIIQQIAGGGGGTSADGTKMKRSPRFCSFDSHASLTEYTTNDNLSVSPNSSLSFVQRSRSNYDMDSQRFVTQRQERKSINMEPSMLQSTSNSSLGGVVVGSRQKPHKLNNSEFSAVLPDFVQDHLVMEQWYSNFSGSPNTSPMSLEFDHLPDFALNDSNFSGRKQNRGNNHNPDIGPNDIPFDLMCSSSGGGQQRNNSPTIPLDLRAAQPTNNPLLHNIPFDLPSSINHNSSHSQQHQLHNNSPEILRPSTNDIPLDLTERSNGSGNARPFNFDDPDVGNRNIINGGNGDQTLPDFLSDGPIHSNAGRYADVAQNMPSHFDGGDEEEGGQPQMMVYCYSLRLENQRLRHELDTIRRISADQSRRITELETTLDGTRNLENQYSINLAQSMEQVEENLDRSNKRAAAAQSLVTKFKQQVKQLNIENSDLRRENEALRENGAVGGSGGGAEARSHSMRPLRSQQLSRDLTMAAASAESHLKQLLTGVENLRLMASSLENMDTVREPVVGNVGASVSSDFIPDFCDDDDDEATGPAL